VLSYVAGVVDDLVSGSSAEDLDADALLETLCAYVPNLEGNLVTEEALAWVTDVANMEKEKRKQKHRCEFNLQSVIESSTAAKKSGGGRARVPSSSNSSVCSFTSEDQQVTPAGGKGARKSASRLASECSDGGSSSDCGDVLAADEETLKTLLEMFPYACGLEANHCLGLAAGDAARAAQLIMHRHEAGQSLKPVQDRKVSQKGWGCL